MVKRDKEKAENGYLISGVREGGSKLEKAGDPGLISGVKPGKSKRERLGGDDFVSGVKPEINEKRKVRLPAGAGKSFINSVGKTDSKFIERRAVGLFHQQILDGLELNSPVVTPPSRTTASKDIRPEAAIDTIKRQHPEKENEERKLVSFFKGGKLACFNSTTDSKPEASRNPIPADEARDVNSPLPKTPNIVQRVALTNKLRQKTPRSQFPRFPVAKKLQNSPKSHSQRDPRDSSPNLRQLKLSDMRPRKAPSSFQNSNVLAESQNVQPQPQVETGLSSRRAAMTLFKSGPGGE